MRVQRGRTLRKSLISFTWSATVNVRFVKLLKNLRAKSKKHVVEHTAAYARHDRHIRSQVFGHRL
jgi:hypothetical protein